MTSKPNSILAVLLMAASGGMVAPAQALEDQTPLPLPTFGEVDIDNNGFISTGETVAVPGLFEESVKKIQRGAVLLSTATSCKTYRRTGDYYPHHSTGRSQHRVASRNLLNISAFEPQPVWHGC